MKASLFRRHQGFTLIEILAVVMLIGIIATSSVVMFSTGGPQKELDESLEQFVEVSRQVADISILTGEPVGLVMTPPAWSGRPISEAGWSYSWQRFVEVPSDEGQSTAQWTSIENVNPVNFSVEMDVFVHLEGQEWDWRATPKNDQPIFVIYPTGEAEPFLFEVEFSHSGLDIEPQHVKLDETGKLQWVEAQEALEAFQENNL